MGGGMFEKARSDLVRLKELRDSLDQASGERDFLVRFTEFISAAQTVLIDILREGRGERLTGFTEWYERKREEMDGDELLTLVREARDHDFGDGPHRLRFISGQHVLTVDDLGRPVDHGVWWSLPKAPGTHVSVDHPPQSHQGQKLDRTDPEMICELAYQYLEELVSQASATLV